MRRSWVYRGMFSLAVLACIAAPTIQALAGRVQVSNQWNSKGRIELRAAESTLSIQRSGNIRLTAQIPGGGTVSCSVALLSPAAKPVKISSCKIIDTSDKAVTCLVQAGSPTGAAKAAVTMNERGELSIKPLEGCQGVHVAAEYAFCVLPSRQIDDCIYDAQAYTKLARLYLPSESLLMGLIRGENAILTIAWPPAGQVPSLLLAGHDKGRRKIGRAHV